MFGVKKKKREKASEVDLNRVVTPMLDMTFQILFFLIMNFRLPTPEGQVDLLLPDPPSGDPKESPVELDKKDDEYSVRLLVSADSGESQGLLAGMTWKPKNLQQAEGIAQIDGSGDQDDYARGLDRVLYGFYRKLKEVQPKEGGAQPQIKIEADGRLRYSELLRVMDVARKLKFQNIGVMLSQKTKE
jgi:biopolymer transport protein ExbD